jgi:hypothetical protein
VKKGEDSLNPQTGDYKAKDDDGDIFLVFLPICSFKIFSYEPCKKIIGEGGWVMVVGKVEAVTKEFPAFDYAVI